jgi:hypothetical protein
MGTGRRTSIGLVHILYLPRRVDKLPYLGTHHGIVNFVLYSLDVRFQRFHFFREGACEHSNYNTEYLGSGQETGDSPLEKTPSSKRLGEEQIQHAFKFGFNLIKRDKSGEGTHHGSWRSDYLP